MKLLDWILFYNETVNVVSSYVLITAERTRVLATEIIHISSYVSECRAADLDISGSL